MEILAEIPIARSYLGLCNCVDKAQDEFLYRDCEHSLSRDLAGVFQPTRREARRFNHGIAFWGLERPESLSDATEEEIEEAQRNSREFRLLVLGFAIAMCETGDF
jgi:hypothetical protein